MQMPALHSHLCWLWNIFSGFNIPPPQLLFVNSCFIGTILISRSTVFLSLTILGNLGKCYQAFGQYRGQCPRLGPNFQKKLGKSVQIKQELSLMAVIVKVWSPPSQSSVTTLSEHLLAQQHSNVGDIVVVRSPWQEVLKQRKQTLTLSLIKLTQHISTLVLLLKVV